MTTTAPFSAVDVAHLRVATNRRLSLPDDLDQIAEIVESRHPGRAYIAMLSIDGCLLDIDVLGEKNTTGRVSSSSIALPDGDRRDRVRWHVSSRGEVIRSAVIFGNIAYIETESA